MGEILDRSWGIVKRRVFPGKRPFKPSLEQLNDARATLEELRRVKAVSEFAAAGMGQVVEKQVISDRELNVNDLVGIGSARITNLYRVVTYPVPDIHLEIDDLGQLEYALDLTKRAEEQRSEGVRTSAPRKEGSGGDFWTRVLSQRVSRRGLGLTAAGIAVAGSAAVVSWGRPESEKDKWKRSLGADVEVKDLPPYVTPEIIQNLEDKGFMLIYMPKLDLGTHADLRRMGTPNYLRELEGRYPRWKPYETSFRLEAYISGMSGNLSRNYWDSLIRADNKSEFPNLPGQWLAVEDLPRPNRGESYKPTWVGHELGARNAGWRYINSEKAKMLAALGFNGGADIRLPKPVEYNLIFNRERGRWCSNGSEVTEGGFVIGETAIHMLPLL